MAFSDPLSAHKELVTALHDPRCYPHPVDRVHEIETHISTILLAGEYAYKIKKPVHFGFVDYLDLERRRYFCGEELRLNRRLAPHIYLDVVAITGSARTPRIGGTGAAIEYAVQMRRFPQECRLDFLLARNDVSLEEMAALGRQLADFHAGARTPPADSPYGSPAAIVAPVRDTLTDLAHLLPTRNQALAALTAWCEASMERLADTFEQRRHQGAVRECHGDLHLANIVRWPQEVTVFDGVEFNPELIWIDVMCDIAFALMDLEHRGAPRHAHRLLSAYLECGGDYPGLVVLDFYKLYRALVRAKIAALRRDQLDSDDPASAAAQQEATDYLLLAQRYTAARTPALYITCGLSGSGKSTVAQHLVDEIGAVRIRSDVERKRLFGMPADARSGAGLQEAIYTPEASERTYRRLASLAEAALRAGYTTVVDAAFLHRRQREPFIALARRLQVPCAILVVHAAEQVLAERITARQARAEDPSEATLEVLRHQLGQVEWPTERESACIRVDTDSTDWAAALRGALPAPAPSI